MHENPGGRAEVESDLGRARAALDAVQSEPRHAEHLASRLLAEPDLTPPEEAAALWALGRAQSELDRPLDACTTLETARERAEDEGLPSLAAEIRVSRSVCLMTTGDAPGARHELELAEPELDGAPLGRLLMQRALLDLHAGWLTDARAGFDRAEPLLVAGGDQLATCRLLANRGVVHSHLGDLARAERDLVRCHELAVELQQHLVAAGATQNLGYLRGRSGDIPGALDWFARAREAYEELGMPARLATSLETDLCGVLLAGGLHREAVEAAMRAERAATASGNHLARAEATLLRAQAMLAQGDEGAEAVALEASAAFHDADRRPYAAYADHVALQAAALGEASTGELVARATDLIAPLDEHGWRSEAAEVRTVAGRLALDAGDVASARSLLGAAARDRSGGTAGVRADGWLATAHLRLVDGDRGGARRALRAGIKVVRTHRASLGATELRTRATRHATDLAALGLELAVDEGRPAELLRWAEIWHAGTLALAPVRPPRDGRLAHALDELRSAEASLKEATLVGDDTAAANAEVSRLERAVRDISRTSSSASGAVAPGGSGGSVLDLRSLRADLGAQDATLVEYVVVRDRLWAVRVTSARCRAVDLGPLAPVADVVRQLLASLRRLAHGRASARSLAAARSSIEELGTLLDRMLVLPLRLAAGPVVVVPTSVLQGLPWSALPSLTERSLTVAPSALVWQRGGGGARSIEPRPDRVALVAGPDLDHAGREVAAVGELYADPVVLVDPEATVSRVLDAMEGVSTLHLAAHGSLRADNPFFTALQASDGPLTVYDLEQLVHAPRTVVLPACDAGLSSVRTGDELVGTAAALVSVGVATVVAPLTVVADAAVVDLMVDLHRELVAGRRPGEALASARRSAIERGGPGDVSAAHSFVAVGTRHG